MWAEGPPDGGEGFQGYVISEVTSRRLCCTLFGRSESVGPAVLWGRSLRGVCTMLWEPS